MTATTAARHRWQIPPHTWLALVGGLACGLVGALLFALAHAVIIVPIWSRMWSGLASGSIAGMAAAWALAELEPDLAAARSPRAAAFGARFGAMVWLLVAPVTIVDAALRAAGVAEQSDLVQVGVAVALAMGAGAAYAWRRTHRRRAAIAGDAATLMSKIAMAGPVPIMRSPRAFGIFLAVLPAAAIAGAVLALVVRRSGAPRSASARDQPNVATTAKKRLRGWRD